MRQEKAKRSSRKPKRRKKEEGKAMKLRERKAREK